MAKLDIAFEQIEFERCMAQLQTLELALIETNARAQALIDSMQTIRIIGKEFENDAGRKDSRVH